jgi:hypothetical protein
VLEGTISDAMLPLGQLSSQPPLLQPSQAPTGPEAAEDETADDAAAGDAESAASPEETATPAPDASGTP